MKLEKMVDFFSARVDTYDEHMLENIEGAEEFYQCTADLMPADKGAAILDLGCGTGLELGSYFGADGKASVTAIDLSADMLAVLKNKFAGKNINCICGSYFDTDFGEEKFDCAVSVESLHHFDAEKKLGLYRRLNKALKNGGKFVLTDYFAQNAEQEKAFFEELEKLKTEQGIEDGEYYHFDTPLTVRHECRLLKEAGFVNVKVVKSWGSTCMVTAYKGKDTAK